jgi:hypothetical protein
LCGASKTLAYCNDFGHRPATHALWCVIVRAFSEQEKPDRPGMQASKIAQSFPHHAGCFHNAAMRRAMLSACASSGLFMMENT